MPAVPAFAGDLHADDSLGTRAIMEYQYNSICRGGNSIMERATKAGVPNVKDYIRFYNLRNYDRISAGGEMRQVEKESGVSYEDARREHDDVVGAGYDGRGEGTGAYWGRENPEYESYQKAGAKVSGSQWDNVSACYMDGGPDIRSSPWNGSPEEEMDAFVSEGVFNILPSRPSSPSLTKLAYLPNSPSDYHPRALHPLQDPHRRRPHRHNRFRKPQ